MKLLIDAQLPRRLAHQLHAARFETLHTPHKPTSRQYEGI
jgi:predicted nuclease of predicted toxin-antitoxin system